MVTRQEHNFLFIFFQEMLACYFRKLWNVLKLSVKLSSLIGVLDVYITLVESFMHQTNLKWLFTTGWQTVAQYQMSSMSLMEVFTVKQFYPFSSLNLDWFQSLLKEPLERVSAPSTLVDNNFKMLIVCNSYLLFPKKSSAEFSVTLNSVREIRVNA